MLRWNGAIEKINIVIIICPSTCLPVICSYLVLSSSIFALVSPATLLIYFFFSCFTILLLCFFVSIIGYGTYCIALCDIWFDWLPANECFLCLPAGITLSLTVG